MAQRTLLPETLERVRAGLDEDHKNLTDEQIDNTAIFLSTLGVGALSTVDESIMRDVGFLSYMAANLLAPIVVDAINGGLVDAARVSNFVKEKEVAYTGGQVS